jgi:lipopolysaccharide export system protein LptC
MDAPTRFDRGHSRLVWVLKVVLPLTALVLLSMVFLLAETVDPTRAIPLAEIDVEDRARDPRVSGASFAGVTDGGAALRITAETARTDPAAVLRLDAEGLTLVLEGPAGGRVTGRADTGAIDRGAGTFEMTGAIELTATPGYRLVSDLITGALDRTWLTSPGPVSGAAPAGDLQAGALRVTQDPARPHSQRLVFWGGVRLVYHPHEDQE